MDATNNLDLIDASQAFKEVTANALLAAASPSMLFARRASTTAALTWGYYGGGFLATTIANDTKALTASNTNYLVANRSTGVVSVSTSNTNWNDTTTYGRLYLITTDASGVTDYEDWRGRTGGILLQAGATPSGAAGGDLSGTYPNPSVVDDSHAHTASTLSGVIKPDGSVAFTADQSLGSHKLTNVTDPASAQDAATKAYVDAIAVNLGKRARVRAGTTANITIATALNNGDSLDGVTLATGDLVLVKDQSAPAENGVYVVGVSPARDAQFDTYDEHPGSLLAVEEGSTNADTLWLCTSNVGGTLNTTAIAFSALSVSGGITQLTGDVTAGPGTGSQVATVVDDSHNHTRATVNGIGLTEAPSDQGYTGVAVSFTYGESLTPGAAVYFASDGTVKKADANGASTYPAIGIALETASSGSHLVLLLGIYRDDTLFSWTVGGLIYLSTTAGGLTQTQPNTTDDVIQIIGVATHADRMFVSPQLNYATHT